MLEELLAGSLVDAAARRDRRPLQLVEQEAIAQRPAVDARGALTRSDTIRVIAEVKRASPSRGALADIPEPAELAAAYEAGGAAAISVLTEERKFRGSLDDLVAVRDAVSVPVLRKEFIGEEYQLLEARAAGADMALLIVAALPQDVLVRLARFTEQLGMHALVEAHDADEVDRAVDAGATIIGVNARDLRTFELHPERFASLSERIPSGVVRVAESAVTSVADVQIYRDAGADAVLVGEALVTGDDPEGTVRKFASVH